jgi:hypothetical protein
MGSVAAAGAAAASGASEGLGAGAFGGFAIGRRCENGKLNGFLGALALWARDDRGLVHDDALVALAAIVAKVFVDGHLPLPVDQQHYACENSKPARCNEAPDHGVLGGGGGG